MSDLIDRQAAIDAINVKNVNKGIISALQSIIEELPSAQSEPKKGKWIYNSPVTMKCNQCELVIKDWDWHRFNYCPNCGARMEGKDE